MANVFEVNGPAGGKDKTKKEERKENTKVQKSKEEVKTEKEGS